jgi:hypothetical protein
VAKIAHQPVDKAVSVVVAYAGAALYFASHEDRQASHRGSTGQD